MQLLATYFKPAIAVRTTPQIARLSTRTCIYLCKRPIITIFLSTNLLETTHYDTCYTLVFERYITEDIRSMKVIHVQALLKPLLTHILPKWGNLGPSLFLCYYNVYRPVCMVTTLQLTPNLVHVHYKTVNYKQPENKLCP